MHKRCWHTRHRRIELELSERRELGDVALGRNQDYVRLNVKIQDWNCRDLIIQQDSGNLNFKTKKLKENSIHWCYFYIFLKDWRQFSESQTRTSEGMDLCMGWAECSKDVGVFLTE